MRFDFQAQRVLITGGTSGIGFAIAQAFADAGAAVTATGLTDALAVAAAGRDSRIQFRALDVRDSAAVTKLVGDFDSLNVLVNCAGMLRRGGAEFVEADFLEVLDTNLSGTMRLCLACRPLLAKSHGCVVNTASMLSFFGSGFVPAYSASKGGVAQLTKSLAIAWAVEGIRVNAVAPGWIETPMTQPLVENSERSQPILDRTPLRRWGRSEEIAGPVLFLCSPAAAFMTGVVMPVDGGYSIA
ncbi:MAG: SDR family oxidoreductase [Planctomycetota bacterium]|nr:MAG: SDR family oxidoreductase [Planctomycetota bacterium]GDY09728.1 short-chain dehydrogenase [Planctomycetia bacterium]